MNTFEDAQFQPETTGERRRGKDEKKEEEMTMKKENGKGGNRGRRKKKKNREKEETMCHQYAAINPQTYLTYLSQQKHLTCLQVLIIPIHYC